MKLLTQGSHANHDLEIFDDVMADLEMNIKVQDARYKELMRQATEFSDTANTMLQNWKASIKDVVEMRASEAIAKVEKWKEDMMWQIQDLYNQGTAQAEEFCVKMDEMGKGTSMVDTVNMILTTTYLESWKSLEQIKRSLDDMEICLKGYSTVSLKPNEALSDQWTVELGQIKSVGMLGHLTAPGESSVVFLPQTHEHLKGSLIIMLLDNYMKNIHV
jgi:hypothetical protein